MLLISSLYHNTVIIRQVLGNCCEWCQNLAGTYDADDAPRDIYRRHDNCKCMVVFKSDKKYTNIHTKSEFSEYRDARINAQALANMPVDGKMKKRRKREDDAAGIELAHRRLRKELSAGTISIIGEKILLQEVSIEQRKQKFLQHKKGTAQHESATKGRKKKQSYLNADISEEDAQSIIISKCGKGTPDINENHIREYMNLDKLIGFCYDGAEWVETKRIMIDYSSKGAHIVPVTEK